MRCPIEIKKGSHLLHPQHGVGQVESVRKRCFAGQPAATYAQLYFERDSLTLIVLADELTNTFRNLVSRDEANTLLEKMKQWDVKPKKQWKARADAHQRCLDSGDPVECVKVLKGLAKIESADQMRQQDRNHQNLSLDRLTDELSRVLKKQPAQTRKLIIEAVAG